MQTQTTPRPSVPAGGETSGLDRYFGITRRGSTVGREVRGGLVTFFTMAYILALNPIIIGTAADKNGNLISGAPAVDANIGHSMFLVACATALVAGVMTLLMGIFGRFPMALATGLGLNALVAYTIAPTMTWPQAMGLVVWEGILIAILVATGFRTAVFRAVPKSLRTAISVGIGLFIAFVGLVDAGIVRPGAGTPVQLGIFGSLTGWPIAIFIVGLLLVIALHVKQVKGGMLISIIVTTILAVILQSVHHIDKVSETNPTGWMLNWPQFDGFSLPNLGLLGKVDLFGAFAPEGKFDLKIFLGLLLLVFSLLLADFFDTMGTVVAVGSEGGLLDEDGMPEHTTAILMVDSLAAAAGGLGSVSSNTSYIESTAGVAEGARTGFASVVTGAAFLLAVVLAPFVKMIPSEAAAPVLVFVGFLMIAQVLDIDWHEPEVGIPAFLAIIMMPFSYSITVGIGFGFIAYMFIKIVRGHAKSVHPLMWLVGVLFVIYFLQGPLLALLS